MNMTAAEYQQTLKTQPSKYKNKIITLDGHRFASQLEADYYSQLKILQRAGHVKNFTLQPRFVLQEAYVNKFTKQQVKKIEYVADFLVRYDTYVEIVDCKGVKTAVYSLKKKWFECKYPDLRIVEVSS